LLLVAAGLITSREITRSANMRGQIQILNVSLEQRVKERTARLHLSEQRIRILLESTAEAILGENMDGNCTFCNAAAEHLLGYTNAELIGKNLRSLMHHPASVGTGTSPQECPLYQAVRTGRPFHSDGITYWRKDGTAFLAECWSHPLIEGEKTIGSVLAFFDVTKRKQAEEEAREVRVRLESALASMTDAVFISDAQGRFINFNDAFAKFHRFKNKANCAKTFAEYPHFLEVFLGNSPEAAPLEMWAVPRALRGESVVDAEYTLQRKDTGESWMGSYSFAPIRGRSEEVVGAVVICRDITQTKANEREFRRLNEELEQRVQERTAELEAFAYSVSHDLRAPLRHINGFSKILMEECGASLTGDAQHSLQRIMEGATRMGHLIDDLLSLSRLGRQSLSPQITGLNALVLEVFAGLAPDAAGRRVEWKVGELGHANCDPALMRQVFQNLLSNALKYTRPRTEAIIEVGLQQQDGTPVLYVRDNGVGFSMKYVDKLFGVFQRLHRAEEFEGTGVGLATVRRIIQKHGGRIWAEAEPDKGATFSFTLGDSGAARPAAETKCVGDAA